MEQTSLGRFPLVFSAGSLNGLYVSEVTSILAERLTHKVNADSDRLRLCLDFLASTLGIFSSHDPDGDMKPRTLSWTWISESFFNPQVRWWPSAPLTQGRDGPIS